MKTVDCYRPGCYCTVDHQVTPRAGILCPRCHHNRLVIGRLKGDL